MRAVHNPGAIIRPKILVGLPGVTCCMTIIRPGQGVYVPFNHAYSYIMLRLSSSELSPRTAPNSLCRFYSFSVASITNSINMNFTLCTCPPDIDNRSQDRYYPGYVTPALVQSKKLECPECKSLFDTTVSLCAHYKTHSLTSVVCTHNGCNKMFANSSQLSRHVKTVHLRLKVSCPRCGLDCSPANYSRHLKLRCPFLKYYCLLCCRVVNTEHKCAVGYYYCPVATCLIGFSSHSELIRHRINVHRSPGSSRIAAPGGVITSAELICAGPSGVSTPTVPHPVDTVAVRNSVLDDQRGRHLVVVSTVECSSSDTIENIESCETDPLTLPEA